MNELTEVKAKGIMIGSVDAPEIQPIEEGDTIRLPRLSLIQGDRAEIRDGLCTPGDILNNLTRQNHGKEVTVVPLLQRPISRIRWGNRDNGGGILCISRNKMAPQGDPGDKFGACERCPFYANHDAKEGCSMNYELIALVVNGDEPQLWDPVILTADSIKPADTGVRDMLANIRYGYPRGIRMFHKSYTLKSTGTVNKKGQHFSKLTCMPNALLPKETIEMLEMMMRSYSVAKIEQEEPAPAVAGQAADAWVD